MEKLTELKAALSKHGVEGMTVFPVLGCGAEKGTKEYEVDKNFVMELLRVIFGWNWEFFHALY